jgi:predicted amidohydrolase
MNVNEKADDDLKRWCQLYKKFVINDEQHLVQVIMDASIQSRESCFKKIDSRLITKLLAKSDLEESDYLSAYGQLRQLDEMLQHPQFPPIVDCLDSRYLMVHSEQHPIIKAIPEDLRFKLDSETGNNAVLGLHYHWLDIGSSHVSFNCSETFNALTGQLTIALSPIADYQEMQWQYEDRYFWCTGAKNEQELWNRIAQVLEQSYQQGVDVLLFPELVMTENLQKQISAWLKKHNAFETVIYLVVAGTRHVFINDKKYVNRCTVFNFIGDVLWEQDKSQRFELPANDAKALLQAEHDVYEPNHLAEQIVIYRSKLGRIATPICLDFIKADGLWQKLAVDLFLVPAMSKNLKRFQDSSKQAGNRWGSAVFVCNAAPNDKNSVYVYLPSKEAKEFSQHSEHLFTIDVDIDMN